MEAAPSSIAQLERVIQNYVPEGSDDVEWMLWIDGWGEALRNPMMRKISQQLDEQSIELLARIIRIGVESGEFSCPDPAASAMRLTALVDGLAVQFAAHDGMMNRDHLIHHVRFANDWLARLKTEDPKSLLKAIAAMSAVRAWTAALAPPGAKMEHMIPVNTEDRRHAGFSLD